MTAAPPLRFLALVIGGWICARAAVLLPEWWAERGSAAVPDRSAAAPDPVRHAFPADPSARRSLPARRLSQDRPMLAPARAPEAPGAMRPVVAIAGPLRFDPQRPRPVAILTEAPPPTVPVARTAGRWSGSAWMLVRGGGGPSLAPGGTLGGSQAGLRLSYRLNGDPERSLAISGRLYLPRRSQGAEAAFGLEWRPSAALPVALLAERRQRLGREGRSGFALALHGGGSLALPAGLRLDGYGQAGIVGLRARDPFVDGALRVSLPLGPVEVGAAAWGAAQPGAERLDAGPSLSLRLPGVATNVRLSAEWRFRIAGDAAPGSGPALTLGSDF